MPDNICSSCLAMDIECTHDNEKKKRGPKPGTKRTVLSQSCRELVVGILKGTASEDCLTQYLTDDTSITSVVIQFAKRIKNLEVDNDSLRRELNGKFMPGRDPALMTGNRSKYLDHSKDVEQLSKDFSEFSVSSSGQPSIHLGESSNMMLALTAMRHRKEVDSSVPDWQSLLQANKRLRFWDVPSWLPPPKSEAVHYKFPDDVQLKRLTDIYFSSHNSYFHLLHRPTFEKAVFDRLHLRDEGFGALLLAVCALGQYLSAGNTPSSKSETGAVPGWEWFDQLPIKHFAFGRDLSLYHFQMYCIAMIYISQLDSSPDICWMLTGLSETSTIEGELWKRLFWMLIFFDVKMSLKYGRPRAISVQDFDIGLPLECDNEYWENPSSPFVQPPGKPSMVSSWIHHIKLLEITLFATEALYSVRKSEVSTRMGLSSQQWQERTVLEIDSALNKWAESVPDHLRWDATNQDGIFFYQSSMLYTTYYWTQIQVHRRFIPRPGQDSRLSFPSLTICTNAARSCIRIVDACVNLKQTETPILHFEIPLFSSAMIFAVNLWRGKQVNSRYDPRFDLAQIYKCVQLLRAYELRHASAGRLVDIINAVMSATLGSEHNLVVQETTIPVGSEELWGDFSSHSQNYLSNHQHTSAPLLTAELGQAQLPFSTPSESSSSSHSASSYTTSNLGYNHFVSNEELAIFDDTQTHGDAPSY
ncbi:hypothetical protein D9758_012417 [Tetrapyrgos nigripes]|uniref:Xylanolytic transcriptional activator regulatory domain-containing protein n=1 Tax=Tetrapyrgos nigripes TaxID=182062 RepID=A0A8H5FZM5_9AGAR|nr:hypothetical protein D9758_012417 [Tetrapyrgos nigripes]